MQRGCQIFFILCLSVLTGMHPALALDTGQAQQQLNDIRRQLALPKLSISSTLTNAARKQAAFIASKQVLSHTAGGSLRSRIRAAGFTGNAGENLGRGQKTMSKVIIGWMNSPSHRANILDPSFTCFGLGSSPDSGGKPYWVLFLGTC